MIAVCNDDQNCVSGLLRSCALVSAVVWDLSLLGISSLGLLDYLISKPVTRSHHLFSLDQPLSRIESDPLKDTAFTLSLFRTLNKRA